MHFKEDELSLSQFWDALEVNKLQIEKMESIKQQLEDMKDEVTQERNELEERKENLELEIKENLKRLRELKTPK